MTASFQCVEYDRVRAAEIRSPARVNDAIAAPRAWRNRGHLSPGKNARDLVSAAPVADSSPLLRRPDASTRPLFPSFRQGPLRSSLLPRTLGVARGRLRKPCLPFVRGKDWCRDLMIVYFPLLSTFEYILCNT